MEKKVYELKISETLEHVIPPLQEIELNLLTQSLLSEGCRDPLVVWNGVVVDGNNRYQICRENNIPFSFVEMEFKDESEAKRWIIRNQLARRNVPDFVKCELVLPLEAELKAEAKKRQIRKPADFAPQNSAGQNQGRETREELAELAGVSRDTIGKVKKIIAEADEETKEKLRKDEMSIHRAFTSLKDKGEQPHQVARRGDLVPGFGTKEILKERAGQSIARQPDSVYNISPIEVYGNTPSDNLEMRATVELTHAKSDLLFCSDNYLRRVGEILRGMSADSVNDENMQVLRDIVTDRYNQIVEMINTKLNGGKENE